MASTLGELLGAWKMAETAFDGRKNFLHTQKSALGQISGHG
jgi:hypothetical protein